MSRPHFSTAPPAVTPAPRPRFPPALLAVGYLVFTVAGVLTAIIEVLLVPTRIGTVLIPVAPVLAIVSNVALPAISRGLTDSMLSCAPPVIGWVLAAFVLASARPEGDVLLPAGDTTWVSYGLLLCGAIAGLVTISRAGGSEPWTGARFRRFRPGSARAGSDTGDVR